LAGHLHLVHRGVIDPPVDTAAGAPAERVSWRHDAAVLIVAATVYFAVRELVEGTPAQAARNARRIIRFEQALGLDIEQRAERFAAGHELVRALGNFSYVWLHWPLLVVALVVLRNGDRQAFLRVRDAMCWSGAVGLVLFATFPVAPPRFMPGFEGTVSDAARRHHLPYPIEWSNRFASFPSFHVGWTLIACVAVASLAGAWWLRGVLMVPAVLVALAVVTTGNHYVVDAVAGVAIVVAAYMWSPLRARHRRRGRAGARSFDRHVTSV